MAKEQELPKDPNDILDSYSAITVKGRGFRKVYRTYPGNEFHVYHTHFGQVLTCALSVDSEPGLIWDTTKFRGSLTMGKRQVVGHERRAQAIESMQNMGAVLIGEVSVEDVVIGR